VMGTRADFYVGRGPEAEWLGSIAWDGNPSGVGFDRPHGATALRATTEEIYRRAVNNFLASRDDATFPVQGWPWPWDDSNTTDYAYAFENGAVYASSFGYTWFPVHLDAPHCGEPEESGSKGQPFPDMTARKAVTYGPRSGVIVLGFGSPKDGA
jgi:hypothetical protein